MKKYFLIFVLLFSSFFTSATALEDPVEQPETTPLKIEALFGSWRFSHVQKPTEHTKNPVKQKSFTAFAFPRQIVIEDTKEFIKFLRIEEELPLRTLRKNQYVTGILRTYSYPFALGVNLRAGYYAKIIHTFSDQPLFPSARDHIVFIEHKSPSVLRIDWIFINLKNKAYRTASYLLRAEGDQLLLKKGRQKTGQRSDCYSVIRTGIFSANVPDYHRPISFDAQHPSNLQLSLVPEKAENVSFKLYNSYKELSGFAKNCFSHIGYEYVPAVYVRD